MKKMSNIPSLPEMVLATITVVFGIELAEGLRPFVGVWADLGAFFILMGIVWLFIRLFGK